MAGGEKRDQRCCCCFKLATGMKGVYWFLVFNGTLNLVISIANVFRGFPMAIGDFVMVPPQYWLCFVMARTFRKDSE